MTNTPDLGALRHHILASYSEKELRRFVNDHPAYASLRPDIADTDSQGDVVDKLLNFARHRSWLHTLPTDLAVAIVPPIGATPPPTVTPAAVNQPLLTPENPYMAGGTVKDPAMFFGRHQAGHQVRDRLRKEGCTAIIGLRRVGKSSFLYQLAHQTDLLPPMSLPCYVDLQDAACDEPLSLLQTIWKTWQPHDQHPVVDMRDFSSRVKGLHRQNYRLIICLDEMECLTTRPAFDDPFFEKLRALANGKYITFVTASRRSLYEIMKLGSLTSQFYNIFTEIDLGGLGETAVHNLLTIPFQRVGLPTPSSEALAKVAVLAGGIPFYLQLAADHLFQQYRIGGGFHPYLLKEAFLRQAHHHFVALWGDLTPEQQACLRQLVGLPAPPLPNADQIATTLARLGLLVRRPIYGAGWRLFSAPFACYIQAGQFDN